MYIYLSYYRMVCTRTNQVEVLNFIEATAKTRQFINKSGRLVTKHKATLGQWGVLNIGLSKF